MDGSPELTRPRRGFRRLVALLGLVALIATGCSQDSGEVDSLAAESDGTSEVTDVAGSLESDGVAGQGLSGSIGAVSTDVDGPHLVAPSAEATKMVEALAFASESSAELSYSFAQGMAMDLALFGLEFEVSSDGPYAVGQVDGSMSHLEANVGSFMEAAIASFGLDLDDPMVSELFGEFDGLDMEVWTNESTIVIDMSSLGAAADFSGQLEIFANGPISIDLDQLEGRDDLSLGSLVDQFGDGAQITEPAAILDLLQSLDAATEVGESTIDGTPVTLYVGSMSMSAYYGGLGIDVQRQLSSLEDYGLDLGSSSETVVDSIRPILDEVPVQVTVMVDGDGLVRRTEVLLDMAPMIDAALEVQAAHGQSSFDPGAMSILVTVWQDYNEYGADHEIVSPDAADITAEFAALLAS